MTDIKVRRLGAGLLAATGLLHLVLVPEHLEEAAYIGVLFVLGGLAAPVIATGPWQTGKRLAWTGGALIAAGMAAGFAVSRSIGLPGFRETDLEFAGLVFALIELGFLGALAMHARNQTRELQSP